jgi:hypothetical protein
MAGYSRLTDGRKGRPPLIEALGQLHDCKRFAATGMAELGIAPHVIKAVLDHVSSHKAGVAGNCWRRLRVALSE